MFKIKFLFFFSVEISCRLLLNTVYNNSIKPAGCSNIGPGMRVTHYCASSRQSSPVIATWNTMLLSCEWAKFSSAPLSRQPAGFFSSTDVMLERRRTATPTRCDSGLFPGASPRSAAFQPPRPERSFGLFSRPIPSFLRHIGPSGCEGTKTTTRRLHVNPLHGSRARCLADIPEIRCAK